MPLTPLEQWIKASHAWGSSIDLELTIIIQSLGRLNEQLKYDEERHRHLTDQERAEPGNIPLLDNLFGISRLWVFGCFELVRTLHQYSKIHRLQNPDVKELENLKKKINELRAPLAKLQKAGKKKPLYAVSALARNDGRVGWVLDDNLFITRQELADETLRVILLKNG